MTAAESFQSAILIEVQQGVRRPQMRYLSYYGLARAQAHGATPGDSGRETWNIREPACGKF